MDILNAKKKMDNLSLSRDHLSPPNNIMRATTSMVNGTNNPYNTRSRCSSMHYSFKKGNTQKSRSEIMIDEVSSSERTALTNMNNTQYSNENQRLRISLNKAIKKSTLWQSKFFHLKEKIFRQTQKMTEEVNKTRKFFENKMKNYLTKYTHMLKEIVVSNSHVRHSYL